MIVAGSVLAMLLMGLAVEGFVNSEDEDEDTSSDADRVNDAVDQSGIPGTALSDLLFAAEGDENDEDAYPLSAASGAAPFNYTPLDQIELGDQDGESGISEALADPFRDEASEERADAEWASLAESSASSGTGDFLEVEDLTGLDDGSEVSFVTQFNTDTDELVLEFDGTYDEAPEIEIDHTSEDDAAVVLANGIPVSLVDSAPGLTADHVRVVMSGEAVAEAHQVQHGGHEEEDEVRDAHAEEPVDQPSESPEAPDVLSNEIEAPESLRTALETGPQVLPNQLADLPPPQISPELPTDPAVADTEFLLADPVETVLDPVETIVDEISDGLPLADELTGLLDDISTGLTGMGSTADMLDARDDIDPAFGTGGEDAQTGTFNDDRILGGSGQDALFGDEGDDTLQAGAGNDELHGDTGNDVLEGGAGIDFLDGGEGHDTLDGGADRDLLFGGDGDDVLLGGAAADFLSGGMGSDTLNGGSGDDVLNGTFTGGSSDQDDGDVLWGGDGNDTLIIGRDDVAHGGAGSDTFVAGDYIEDADVAGHVADFNPSEDRIEVIFDPDVDPNPRLEVHDFEDGSGADIVLNGSVILSVSGAQGMDPNLIDLRAVA